MGADLPMKRLNLDLGRASLSFTYDGVQVEALAGDSIAAALFATGVPFGTRRGLPETLKDLGRLMPVCAGVRRWGSAALDLAYVAAGRYDGFWERRLNIWDIAAGIVIVREAGGLVTPITEDGNLLEDGSILCANNAIFDQFAKVIRG